jgi:hypothetical protein
MLAHLLRRPTEASPVADAHAVLRGFALLGQGYLSAEQLAMHLADAQPFKALREAAATVLTRQGIPAPHARELTKRNLLTVEQFEALLGHQQALADLAALYAYRYGSAEAIAERNELDFGSGFHVAVLKLAAVQRTGTPADFLAAAAGLLHRARVVVEGTPATQRQAVVAEMEQRARGPDFEAWVDRQAGAQLAAGAGNDAKALVEAVRSHLPEGALPSPELIAGLLDGLRTTHGGDPIALAANVNGLRTWLRRRDPQGQAPEVQRLLALLK